jgi:hypothetical protein
VGAAQSHALARYLEKLNEADANAGAVAGTAGSENSDAEMSVTMQDFALATAEVRPAMGVGPGCCSPRHRMPFNKVWGLGFRV